jgi:hypothetical protein
MISLPRQNPTKFIRVNFSQPKIQPTFFGWIIYLIDSDDSDRLENDTLH